MLLIIGVMIAAFVYGARARKRRRALLDRMGSEGWRITEKPKGERRDAAFAPAKTLKLPRGAKGLCALLDGDIDGRSVRLIEHLHIRSAGSFSQLIFHVIACVECPKAWPTLRLRHKNFMHKVGAMFGKTDLQVDDDAFNKKWRIDTSDETFAILLLTPGVQAWLMGGDAREVWTIADGWLVCARRGRLNEESFDQLAPRPLELLGMLAPELDAYVPEASP